MGVGTGIAVAGGIGAAGSLGGAALQSGAATSAANVQSQAAEEAAQLQYEEAQQALGFEEQQYKNTMGLEEPQYLSGISGLSTLDQLLGLPGQTPDMSIFENPLGPLQQPGASSSAPGLPGIGGQVLGQLPLQGVPGLNGGGITPMQAESAQAMVPLSTPGGTAVAPGGALTAVGGGATQSPAQQAAAIEGFGGTPAGFQGGPVFSSTQPGSVSLSPGGQSGMVPLSTLAGSVAGTATGMSPNPRFGGSIGSVGPLPTPGQGPLQGAPGGVLNPVPANGGEAQLTVPAGGASGTVPGTSLPPGYLSETWNTPFVAPTAAQAAQMPGYQFQLQQGENAIQNSAAATGGLLSGGTAKALDQYSQGLASTDYQNLYNQALTQYQQAYNIFNQNQANVFNRYAALAGIGQVSAQQLSNAGLSTGSNVGNTLLTAGSQIGQQLNNAAAAQASGYIGSANAYGGALGNLGGLASLASLASVLGGSGAGVNTLNLGGADPLGLNPVSPAVPGIYPG
jgi:hypothetical protein